MHEVVNPKSACGCLQEVFVYSCTRGRFQLTGKVLEFWIGSLSFMGAGYLQCIRG